MRCITNNDLSYENEIMIKNRLLRSNPFAHPSTMIRKKVLIAHGWEPSDVQIKAAAGEDEKLGGVVHALTGTLSKGTRIQPQDAKPGDIIQYWMRTQNGIWFGHAGVISDIVE